MLIVWPAATHRVFNERSLMHVERFALLTWNESKSRHWRDIATGEIVDNKRRSRELCRTARSVSGFLEGVAPEDTPQRFCPHSPVLSRNDDWPTTSSIAMLASTMQYVGADQFEAIRRSARMIANNAATHAVTRNGTDLQRSRASLIALWL